MLMLYVKRLEIREPKAIITFIDNCPKFAWLSEHLRILRHRSLKEMVSAYLCKPTQNILSTVSSFFGEQESTISKSRLQS